jgi:cystathionine beta-lyase/cystathionine gamma-synthase
MCRTDVLRTATHHSMLLPELNTMGEYMRLMEKNGFKVVHFDDITSHVSKTWYAKTSSCPSIETFNRKRAFSLAHTVTHAHTRVMQGHLC